MRNGNCSLGYLRRNLQLSNPSLKELTYITFVRSKLEYAALIWNTWLNIVISSLEAVKYRADRFIFWNYSQHTSVTKLKKKAEVEPLSTRSPVFQISLIHKIYYHNLALK